MNKVGRILFVASLALAGLIVLANIASGISSTFYAALGWILLVLLLNVVIGARRPRKRCPDCAETIQEAAKVCKHCGHHFEPDAGATPATQ